MQLSKLKTLSVALNEINFSLLISLYWEELYVLI